jgi:F-type H+-transporting ATPase subunit b
MLAFPPDITFFIQLVSFFVLLAILNRLLFVPYAAVLAEREARTEGATQDAVGERAEAAELAKMIDAEMSAARSRAAEEAEKIRQRTRGQEAEIFDAAKSAATAKLDELRGQIRTQTDSARGSLAGDARALAEEMTAAILGSGPNG